MSAITGIPLHPVKLWAPKNVSGTAMDRFRCVVNERFDLQLEDYEQLRQWSIDRVSEFWATVWDFCGVIHSKSYEQVVESKAMNQIPAWFAGARLNYAENLLWCRDPNKIALVSAGEGRPTTTTSYAALYDQVRLTASALRKAGLQPGDCVAAYISNCAEALTAMLAATSIGCVWASVSTDFGIPGVLDRLSQIEPKVLFSVNAVTYKGRRHDHLANLGEVARSLHNIGLRRTIVVPFVESASMDLSGIPDATSWRSFLDTADPSSELQFEQLPFDHPVYILFSSGTTGKPKCLVHRAGGMLIQHKKEHMLHGGMTPDDVFFYYTTTGWMMWNWLVSGLSMGCKVVLYDGSPFQPGRSALWELAERVGVTIFGTSAKYIQALQSAGYVPGAHHNLAKLRMILSTGSPLNPENFDYVYKAVKKDVLLGSITGGTDICSLFAGYNVVLPVYRGELQCRCLGMKVEAWHGEDKPVYGQSGDLVCAAPFPCMPVSFWNDPDGKKYRAAYFEQYESVWSHGEFVWINTNTGGVVMLGRSDGTLNPGGVRFGSAEIYNVVDGFPEVADSLVVGQRVGTDERVVLFVCPAEGRYLSDDLVHRIKTRIKERLSSRHVPAVVLAIKEVPYTINGKKVEIAVKRIISGETVVPSGTLANPDSLKQFYNMPQLKL